MPLEQRRVQIAAVYARMAQLYKVDVAQLPNKLGCSADLLRQYQFHGQMPIELIRQCREEHDTSVDWLVYGKHPNEDKLTPEQLDAAFCHVTQRLLLGLSKGEGIEDYWHSFRHTLMHRALRLRKEGRLF